MAEELETVATRTLAQNLKSFAKTQLKGLSFVVPGKRWVDIGLGDVITMKKLNLLSNNVHIVTPAQISPALRSVASELSSQALDKITKNFTDDSYLVYSHTAFNQLLERVVEKNKDFINKSCEREGVETDKFISNYIAAMNSAFRNTTGVKVNER